MSKVGNKRSHSNQADGEKPPQKKVFTNSNKGPAAKGDNKKDTNNGEKKDFKKLNNGPKKFSKDFKGKKDNAKGEGASKKDFKNKEKFDKKAKRIFGTSKPAVEGEENDENGENGVLFSEINQKVNRIQNQKTLQSEKEKLIEDIVQKLEGVLKYIVHKRDGSRAVQACIKNGSEAQKNKIFDILLASKQMEDIIKSKYGHFVAMRMIKFMKSKNIKERFFDVLLKNAFYLVTHVEGAKVLDKFVVNIASPHQFNQLKKLFSTKLENATSLKQEETIENIAAKIIDKGNHNALLSKFILSLSLPILIPVEREKLIEYLREKVLDLLDSKEGIKLAIDLINYSTTKDKKLLVKSLKNSFVEIIKSPSSQAFVVVVKLIFSLDDTILTNKSIIAELKPAIEDILLTKNGISLFSAIFQPKHNALISIEKEPKFTTSKKSLEQKLNEVIEFFLDDLVSAIPKIPQDQLLKDFSASRFLSGVIRYIFINKKESHFDFALTFLGKMIADGKEFLTKKDKTAQFNDDCLLSHHDAHRIAKNYILIAKGLEDENVKNLMLNKIKELTSLLLAHLEVVLSSRAAFLLVALIESDIQKNEVVEKVKKQIQVFQKKGIESKGVTLLSSLIE